jgi:HTH-type transcriptional regulator/antitoxin HipB
MDTIVRTSRQLGSALRRARRRKGLSQGELASRAQLRQATVSELEGGKATSRLDTIVAVMLALDLEIVLRPRTSGVADDIGKLY